MKILIAGDFCPRDRVVTAFQKEDYASVLKDVRELTVGTDYSIVNLECPVVTGAAKPIEKLGGNLCCTPHGVKALQYAGFKCVTLANNHFRDYGEEGVKETLATLKTQGFDYVGGGTNLYEASQVLYKEIAGQRLAIVNCCEHEFSIATETSGGSNPLNPIQQYYAIREAKTQADFVLVIVHGGLEHWQLPLPRMVETYRFFIDAGADVVVNHHQHCYSGYEVYMGKPIFYGLGNFCFDKPQKHDGIWTEGYAVLIDFSMTVKFTLYPYRQCAQEAKVELLSLEAFDKRIKELNSVILVPEKLNKETHDYFIKGFGKYSTIFEPITNKHYLALKQKGWLPSLISKQRKLTAADFICCESHRDRLICFLNS